MKTITPSCALMSLLLAAVLQTGCVFASKTPEQKANIARYEAGKALFDQKCKAEAGYKIYKVVEDVEGIQLLKIRHRVPNGDMNALGAAFALESYDDYYITTFLAYRFPPSQADNSYFVNTMHNSGAIPGFRYVDVIDEKDGQRYRVTGSQKPTGKKDVTAEGVKRNLAKDPNYDLNIYNWVLDRVPAPDSAPRYAVTFDDHVIPEERTLGLASSTVKVLDTQTGEVLGEMLRYAWSPAKPSAYTPNPWETAYKCPGVAVGSDAATRQFVDRVLVAKGAKIPPPVMSINSTALKSTALPQRSPQ